MGEKRKGTKPLMETLGELKSNVGKQRQKHETIKRLGLCQAKEKC